MNYKNALAISDLHLNLLDATNRFYIPPPVLQGYLEKCMLSNDVVLLLGDVVETWTGSSFGDTLGRFRRIEHENHEFFEFLRGAIESGGIRYITGNHDSVVYSEGLLIPTLNRDIIDIGGRKTLLEHGHFADFYNSDGGIIGRTIMWLGAQITRLGIVEADRIWRLFKRHLTPGRIQGNMRVKRYYTEKARRLGCQSVLIGHTHVEDADMSDSVWYGNTGCWVGKTKYLPVLTVTYSGISKTYERFDT